MISNIFQLYFVFFGFLHSFFCQMIIPESDIFARSFICFLNQVFIMYGSWAVKYFAQGVSGMIFDEILVVPLSLRYRKPKIPSRQNKIFANLPCTFFLFPSHFGRWQNTYDLYKVVKKDFVGFFRGSLRSTEKDNETM